MREVTLDLTAMTAATTWMYDGNENSNTLGDVQRLWNGNTLATYSNAGVFHEVNAAARSSRRLLVRQRRRLRDETPVALRPTRETKLRSGFASEPELGSQHVVFREVAPGRRRVALPGEHRRAPFAASRGFPEEGADDRLRSGGS